MSTQLTIKTGGVVPMTLPVASRRSRARSAHDVVLQGIGRAIIGGTFPVGRTLPDKAELMQRFGVSNTPLREALQTLAAKGLVTARTKIGTWVLEESHWNMFDADILAWRLERGLDTAFLRNLFEMRHALEPSAAAHAAANRTEEEVARLFGLAGRLTQFTHDPQRFSEIDLDFHLLVIEASRNPFMRSLGTVIQTALAALFSLSAPPPAEERLAEVALRQHRSIAEAIARGDRQGAADAMTLVINEGSMNVGLKPRLLARVSLEHFA